MSLIARFSEQLNNKLTFAAGKEKACQWNERYATGKSDKSMFEVPSVAQLPPLT